MSKSKHTHTDSLVFGLIKHLHLAYTFAKDVECLHTGTDCILSVDLFAKLSMLKFTL